MFKGWMPQGESAWKLLPPAKLQPLGRDICPRSEQGEGREKAVGTEGRGNPVTYLPQQVALSKEKKKKDIFIWVPSNAPTPWNL